MLSRFSRSSRFVCVIGWSTVVFRINSASNTVRKCKIARGEGECYLLPDCIASAINPKFHSRPSYHKLSIELLHCRYYRCRLYMYIDLHVVMHWCYGLFPELHCTTRTW